MKAVLRIAVVACLLGSAGVHLHLWTIDGLKFVAPLFLLNAISGLLIAIGLLVWRHRLTEWLAVAFGVATLGSYALAETVGIFAQRPHFSTPEEYWATGTEVCCIVGGVVLLALRRRERKAAAGSRAEEPKYVLPILLADNHEVIGRREPGH